MSATPRPLLGPSGAGGTIVLAALLLRSVHPSLEG